MLSSSNNQFAICLFFIIYKHIPLKLEIVLAIQALKE